MAASAARATAPAAIATDRRDQRGRAGPVLTRRIAVVARPQPAPTHAPRVRVTPRYASSSASATPAKAAGSARCPPVVDAAAAPSASGSDIAITSAPRLRLPKVEPG